MKNRIFNKIIPRNNTTKLINENAKLIKIENNELKKNNLQLKKENNNRDTKIKNKHLINQTIKIKKKLEEYNKTEEKLKNHNNQLIKENNQLQKENKILKKLNTFQNFQEFLSNSYVSPIVNAPFTSKDKRVFAFMDNISKYLIQKSKQENNNPLVSIIMPTYNRENIILNAINSILNQSYENWELIIINDGSTDNTLNLLNTLTNDKIKIFTYDENKGHSFARNVGLKKAKGKYIMYLDSDNEWDYRYIETMMGAFIELPDADALYSGQLLYKDYNLKPYAIRFGSFNKPLLHNRNYIDINCFCHKNHIYKEIGGFNEDLIKLVDWDYVLRISNHFKIYSVPVLLSKYYELTSLKRVTNIPFDYYENASKILKKNIIPVKNYKNLSYKVSIIIPSYESLNELKNCIESILSLNFGNMVEIIIVDNNSNNEVKDYLKNLQTDNIKLILNEINYGFTYAAMQGIEISDNQSDILILNNDAALTEGALEHMQNAAYSYDDAGLIVPHEIASEKNPHMNIHVPYAEPKFKCDITPSKEHHNIINMPLFHDGEILELNFAPFFCIYIKRDIYDKSLGLSPELGRHYRSDRIFSDFVRHVLKMKIYQEPHAYVFHKHRVATNLLKRNKNEFDMIFVKNQWDDELSKQLGYKKPLWD